MNGNCHYCGPTDAELRPYGPGGSTVCFACATETPEREAVATGAFGAQFEAVAAMTDIIAIGGTSGPTSLAQALLHREDRTP